MIEQIQRLSLLKVITSLSFCIAMLVPFTHGAALLQRNPPECDKSSEDCGCDNGAANEILRYFWYNMNRYETNKNVKFYRLKNESFKKAFWHKKRS